MTNLVQFLVLWHRVVCACVRACVCACVGVCMHAWERLCMRVCMSLSRGALTGVRCGSSGPVLEQISQWPRQSLTCCLGDHQGLDPVSHTRTTWT